MGKEQFSDYPEEISPAQARVNILSRRLQALQDSGCSNYEIISAMMRIQEQLLGRSYNAVDMKIDEELEIKRKAVK